MHSLPIFVRLEGRPVILVGSGDAADAKRRLLTRAGATIVGEDAPAQLAIVIDDDVAVARLKARGILVNAVDQPELCDFTLPAIVDRDPVLIAIGTGSTSAGLAAALRQRLEVLLPASLGALAEQLHAARDRLRVRWPDANERRQAIGAMLKGPLEKVDVEIAIAGSSSLYGADVERLTVTSPNPEDLTLRQARLLGQADRIYHDPTIAPAILDRARADAVRVPGPPPATLEPGLTIVLDVVL